MPGDDFHKIRKAATLDVDLVCLDLEDGVAANRKQEARTTTAKSLASLDFGRSERLVRVNPVHSVYFEHDLAEILPARPDGIVLPKVTDGDQLRVVGKLISTAEEQNDWSPGSMILIAIVESAQAMVNLASIACTDERLQALIFGAEDFSADIGAKRSASGWEVFYARSAVITHAAAQHLQAIDMVNINFEDDEGLRVQSVQGSRMGYSGKQIIHPNQVEIVQQAFSPSEEEIQQSIEMIENFNQHQDIGQGAFAVDGIMIDAPAVRAAELILERAKAAGKITPDQLARTGGGHT